jgi:ABC-2 type transport system permease protein
MSWRRILHLIRKEFLQLRRDPRLLQIVLVAPVFQLFIFGYAVTTDVKHVALAVYDEDRTSDSRALAARFTNSGYFDLVATPEQGEEVNRLLDAGRAQLVLHIPRGFAKDLARGRAAPLQLLLDGSDSMTASIISGYAAGVLRGYSAQLMATRLDRLRGRLVRVPSLEPRVRVWYNPELKSVNFMVPGIMCSILMVVTTTLTSMAVVKERELGTLEQLIVTPLRPSELMLGKALPFVLIGAADMLLVMTVGTYWFGVRVAGSVPLLFLLSGAFILTTLGVGLFISTISRTQQQAMMTAFFLLLPSFLLSGFMFPIENMPYPIQLITYSLPLRYFLVIVRGIFLRGNGLADLWPQVVVLLGIGIAILSLAAARFHKRVG